MRSGHCFRACVQPWRPIHLVHGAVLFNQGVATEGHPYRLLIAPSSEHSCACCGGTGLPLLLNIYLDHSGPLELTTALEGRLANRLLRA